MNEQVEKPKENKNRAVANSVGRKKSIANQGFEFVDNRPNISVQRKIMLEEPEKTYESIENAIEDARPATKGDDKGTIARQRVRNIFYAREPYIFSNQQIYERDISRFAEEWMIKLGELGVESERSRNVYAMHRNLEHAIPEEDHAIFHKIAKPYDQLLEHWKAKKGVSTISKKGLEYRPWRGHTMPLNYSWLASVTQHQIPVQIVVPITERVLIRPQTRTNTDTPVDTDMDAVRKDEVDAPLSATALEILGLLRNGFYRVDTRVNSGDINIRLVPTGKIITDPTQITAGKTVKYSSLTSELRSYGIDIHPNKIIHQIIAELPAHEEVQPTEQQGPEVDLGSVLNQRSRRTLMIRRALAVSLLALVVFGIVKGLQAPRKIKR